MISERQSQLYKEVNTVFVHSFLSLYLSLSLSPSLLSDELTRKTVEKLSGQEIFENHISQISIFNHYNITAFYTN
jgi:hypothetical protein